MIDVLLVLIEDLSRQARRFPLIGLRALIVLPDQPENPHHLLTDGQEH